MKSGRWLSAVRTTLRRRCCRGELRDQAKEQDRLLVSAIWIRFHGLPLRRLDENMEVNSGMRMRDELFRGRIFVAAVCAWILGAILLNTPGVDQRQSVSAFLLAGDLLCIGFAAPRS